MSTSSISVAHTGGKPVTVTTIRQQEGKDDAVEKITLSPEAAVHHVELDENASVVVAEAPPAE